MFSRCLVPGRVHSGTVRGQAGSVQGVGSPTRDIGGVDFCPKFQQKLHHRIVPVLGGFVDRRLASQGFRFDVGVFAYQRRGRLWSLCGTIK